MIDTDNLEDTTAFKKRSFSFFDVSPTSNAETPKTRKSTMNKYDGDVRSSIKNYYNKFNLVFDPEKYVVQRQASVRVNRSVILDLDSLPEKKQQSESIKFKYSFADISKVFSDIIPSLQKEKHKGKYKYIPAIMTFNPRNSLDHFREKKRERAATFYEQPRQGYELYPKTPVHNNNNNFMNTPTNNWDMRYTLYNPNRHRIGSYNIIN